MSYSYREKKEGRLKMQKRLAAPLACGIALFFTAVVLADGDVAPNMNSPVGLWKTFYPDGRVESLVKISEKNGLLTATVVKVLDKEAKDGNHTRCTWCEGKRKDSPFVGMKIMWGMKKSGDRWEGGWIFDPKRDMTAKCWIELQNSGKTLKVRGYLTFFLGETRYWKRFQ